jgi:hypothetical protein
MGLIFRRGRDLKKGTGVNWPGLELDEGAGGGVDQVWDSEVRQGCGIKRIKLAQNMV